jgi:hypothetical protein
MSSQKASGRLQRLELKIVLVSQSIDSIDSSRDISHVVPILYKDLRVSGSLAHVGWRPRSKSVKSMQHTLTVRQFNNNQLLL